MKLKMTIRLWILLIFLIASLVAINPLGYFEKGVLVKYVPQNSPAALAGMAQGDIITALNDYPISSIGDYASAIVKLFPTENARNFTIMTDKGNYSFSGFSLGIDVDDNLTIVSSTYSNISSNDTLKEINNRIVVNKSDFDSIKSELEQNIKVKIATNKGLQVFYANHADFTVSAIPSTRLKAGLDLAGGAKALVQPEGKLSASQMKDLITVSRERLNVYGLADIAIRSASDLSGNDYMIVEVAGASPAELENLIGQQGKFEAKIGNETVFLGGKKDITSVCRNDASCSGIQGCPQSGSGYSCRFQFGIYLSPEAAERQAELTSPLSVNISSSGERYLSKPLDLYLDDKLVDSLQISSDLKGKATTQISISGPGVGTTKADAFNEATKNMNKLQTVLITGSLPFKLHIVKLDSISPLLGKEFIQNIFLAALGAALGMSIVIFIRYRRIAFSLPILLTVMSEIFIILGVAAAINWNLDLASIAGIIAAIGTGVDNQVVIIDESRNQTVNYSLKEKIKRAFFIIFGSFSTVFVAMLPLWWAGAGMVRGFAVTTIIGICIGVFVTRPAFSDIISQVMQ